MSNPTRKTAAPETAEMTAMGEKVVDKVVTMAGQSLDKAQAAANKATEVAHGNLQMFDATAGALRGSVVDMQLKTIEIAQANTDAAFGFLRDLLAVRDPSALAKVNAEFFTRRSGEMVRQAREMGELATRCACETARPVQEGITRSFSELTRSFTA